MKPDRRSYLHIKRCVMVAQIDGLKRAIEAIDNELNGKVPPPASYMEVVDDIAKAAELEGGTKY